MCDDVGPVTTKPPTTPRPHSRASHRGATVSATRPPTSTPTVNEASATEKTPLSVVSETCRSRASVPVKVSQTNSGLTAKSSRVAPATRRPTAAPADMSADWPGARFRACSVGGLQIGPYRHVPLVDAVLLDDAVLDVRVGGDELLDHRRVVHVEDERGLPRWVGADTAQAQLTPLGGSPGGVQVRLAVRRPRLVVVVDVGVTQQVVGHARSEERRVGK